MIPRSVLAVVVSGLVLIFAVSAIYVAYYLPSNGLCQGPGCSSSLSEGSTLSAEAGNRTVVATYHPPVPDTTSTTSYSTSSYTSGTLPPEGSYTYSPNSQVDVLGVTAVVSGGKYVTFSVEYQNIGSGTIVVIGGGGSSLSANLASGTGAGALIEVQGLRCLIATVQIPLGPGQVHTSTTPGCWSGYSYKLVGSGTMNVQLTLGWSSDSAGGQSSSIVILAEFSLG